MSLNSSSNFSLQPTVFDCDTNRLSISVFTALNVIYYVFLLPLFIFVLYVGYQRWREQRSVATTVVTSHSDIFTFNMVVLEMISLLGSVFYTYGAYTDQSSATNAGKYMYSIISPGQTLFHLLTCVDRYLAVVHPVTYLGLRQSGGVRIRNISIGCVWFLCFGSIYVLMYIEGFGIIFTLLLSASSSIVVSFCSLSVLRILIRPGPGDVGGNRERVDQSKQRAFYTIMIIMGSLLLWFLTHLLSLVLYTTSVIGERGICLMLMSVAWLSLPSSLVLPLLFLQRAGKLPTLRQLENWIRATSMRFD